MPSPTPRSICLLRLSAIGDTCNLVPVVRTLQSALPDTELTWIIGKVEHSLLGDLRGVEFLPFDKRGGRPARRALRNALRGREFDVLLHMHASLRASRLSRYVRARRRIGFDRRRARDFQWLFCNEQIRGESSVHVLDGFFQFAEALGIAERHLIWDIPLRAEDREYAARHIGERTLIISPCSSQRWRNFRNWRADNYAQLAEHAQREHGLRVVLTGGPTELEADYGRQIARRASVAIDNLIGTTTLRQLLACIERAQVLVSPDSGPAHMATAVGTPVIGLYATSNRWRTGPYLSQEWVVDRYPDAVSKALGKRVAELPWGYRVRTPYAMDLITVDDVKAKLDALIAQTQGA